MVKFCPFTLILRKDKGWSEILTSNINQLRKSFREIERSRKEKYTKLGRQDSKILQ